MSFSFTDIEKTDSNTYSYLYLFTIKTILTKKYYKIFFISPLPHYVFMDIWRVLKVKLKNENKFLEDIIEADGYFDLEIGKIQILPFTSNDKIQFSTNKTKWKRFLNSALLKQEEYEREYETAYGCYPDLNLPLL